MGGRRTCSITVTDDEDVVVYFRDGIEVTYPAGSEKARALLEPLTVAAADAIPDLRPIIGRIVGAVDAAVVTLYDDPDRP